MDIDELDFSENYEDASDDSYEVLDDVPVEEPVEVLDDVPVEEPVEELDDIPVEEPVEMLDDIPVEEPVEELDDIPIEEPVEVLDDLPVEEPIEELNDVPADEPVEELNDIPAEEPVEVLDDVPSEESVEVLDDLPVEEPVEELNDVPLEEPAEVLEDVPVEESVEELEDSLGEEDTTGLPNEILDDMTAEPKEFSEEEWKQLVDSTSDSASLEQLREDVLDGKILIEQPDEDAEGMKLEQNLTEEQLESRERDTEEVLENYGENLRARGVEEEQIEAFVDEQRERIRQEYENPLAEDAHYDEPHDWDAIADDLTEATDAVTDEASDIPIVEDTQDIPVDYDSIYAEHTDEFLEEGFENIDIAQNAEQLDRNLESFEPDTWEQLDASERENAIQELADSIKESIGFENPPKIEYYNDPQQGDYGGYNRARNTLSINQFMLYDSEEAADTVAHELWHAYQYECAENPQCERDRQYRANFENYISPQYGQEIYENQLVEAEARAFARQIKNRLNRTAIHRR